MIKIRQNSYGNWVAMRDGRVFALEENLPRLLAKVRPVVGDDLPTPFYEQVLAKGGLMNLIRAARASMARAALTRAAMGRADSGV